MDKAKKATQKGVNKLSKSQIRATANALRTSIAAQEKQLRAIERLLDEEFVSLAQAQRELKRNTQQVKRTTKSALKAGRLFASAFRDAFSAPPTKSQRQTSVPLSRKIPAKSKTSTLGTVSKPSRKGASRKVPPAIKPTPVAVKSQAKSKPIKSTRTLRGKKGETTLQLFERLDAMGDEADKLLKDGEQWMFFYGKGRAKRLYGTFQQAVKRMLGYLLSQGLIDGSIDPNVDDIEQKLVQSIRIVKTNQNPGKYADKKEAESRLRENERKRIRRASRKQLQELGVELPSVFGGGIDIEEKQTEIIRQQREEIAKLKGRNNEAKGRNKAKRIANADESKGKSTGKKVSKKKK